MRKSQSRKRRLIFDSNRKTSPIKMYKTPPKNKGTEAANEPNPNEGSNQRFGSVNDLSRTINVANSQMLLGIERPVQSRSMEDVNKQLDANAVDYEFPRPKNIGTVPKRVVDTTVPPPNLIGRRARKSSEISEELQSFIRLTISESQSKTKEQLGLDIVNAVQAAFEKNFDRIVNRVRSEVSTSPSDSAGSYNLNHHHPKERVDKARPPRDISREFSRPPPAYEQPNVVRDRQQSNNRTNVQQNQNQEIYQNLPSGENLNRNVRPENVYQNRNTDYQTESQEVRHNYASVRAHTKIYEWGLSYEGPRGPTTVEDFIFRVEYLQNHYQCPWSEVLRDFHRLLKGEAIEWYWLSLKSNPYMTWPQLKDSLIRQFRNMKSDFELMRNLVERRQNPGESIDDYFLAMAKLRSMLRVDIDNADLIKIMKRNVRENVSRMVYAMQECKQAEEHLARNYNRHAPVTNSRPFNARSGQVQSVYFKEEAAIDNNEFVEEVQAKPKEKDECFKCHKLGHHHKDCPMLSKKVYCFRCGKEDVIAPKCPECLAKGNARRTAAPVGEQRSKEVPTEN